MSSDYSWVEIDHFEEIEGIRVPMDKYGHYLNWERIDGNKAKELTSPYGSLEYAVGTGDDFVCFDYAILPNGHFVLHATVSSETGSFIDRFEYKVVPKEKAIDSAYYITTLAIEWVESTGERLHIKGWNQDPFYWYRRIKSDVLGTDRYKVKIIDKNWRRNY